MTPRSAIWSAAAALVVVLSASVAHAQTSPSAFTSATRYDLDRRVVGTIAPDPDGGGPIGYAATRNTYDPDGRLVKVETGELAAWQPDTVAPANWGGAFTVFRVTDNLYDPSGRKIRETMSGLVPGQGLIVQAVTQFSYDAMDRLDCSMVRMNPAAFGSLPASACTLGPEGTQGPDRLTRSTYYGSGRLAFVSKAVGTDLAQVYAQYGYNGNGKRTSVRDANGNLATMTYDALDRQVAWNFPSATSPGQVSTTDYEAYTYDNNGNRLSLRKRDGRTITYNYDALNRVTSKILNGTCVANYACTTPPPGAVRDVYYGYDLRGLQLYARFDSPSGEGVTDGYDGFGRRTTSTTAMGGVSRTLTSNFDPDGNRARLKHPDGIWFSATYDGLDRMTNQSWYTPTGGTVPFYGITYDQQGRRAGTYRASSSSTYTYVGVPGLGSLSQNFASGSANAVDQFSYNPASQITGQTRGNTGYVFDGYTPANDTYSVNGLNQYTAVGAGSLGYDSNGNLAATGGTSLTYDVENRLVSAVGTLTLNLVYDPLGRLWQTSGGAFGKSQFLYDGDAMVAEYDGDTGGMRRRFAFGPGVDEPVLWDEGGALNCGGSKFLHPDHQGSIVALADCWGNPVGINSYDDYGVRGANNQGRFQYTGQMLLPELGMYYYKARIYSSKLGRFLQTDPIGYDDQVNLYAYVGNDPVNGRDPTGKFECVPNGDGTSTCTSHGLIDAIAMHAYVAVNNALAAAMSGKRDENDTVPASDRSVSRNDNGGPQDPDHKVSLPIPPEEGRERAKDRRARQQKEDQDRRAERTGGQPDTGGAPRSAVAQNSQFRDLAIEHNLTMDEANRLHQEITGQNLSRSEVAERIRDMFGK